MISLTNESIVLSDLEEGEGDVGEIEDDSILSHSVFSRNESFVERSSIERQTVNKFVDDRQPDYESSLKQNIQFDWWNDETLRIEPDSSHPYARLVTHWEELENKHTHGLLPVGGTLLMTEYKVVREALWMLQQPTSTFLFYVSDGGQVGVKPNISIPSLTPESLAQLLNESFCKYSEIILSLRNFIDDVNSGEIEDKRPPHTYQAYSAALQCQLNVFWQSICKLEKKIMIQESTNTLISVIEELRPEFEKLDFLFSLHKMSVCDWRTAQGWFACVKLLGHLYSAVCTSWKKEFTSISLELFIKSFRVYIQMIDSWFAEGKLLDDRSEFIVARYDEDLKIVAYNDVLKEMRKTEISSIFNTIINSSTDLECIRRLDEITALKTEVGKKHDLFNEFLIKVGDRFRKFKSEANNALEAENKQSPPNIETTIENNKKSESKPSLNFPAKEVDQMFYDLVTSKILESPWLLAAFKEYYPERKSNSEERLENIDSYRNFIETQTEDVTLCTLPVHHIVEDVLVSLITERGSIASKIMVEVLMDRYKLHQHLSILLGFFTLESSHIVPIFYNALFTKSLVNNSIEATENSLNILLDECVECFPGAESMNVQLSVTIEEPDSWSDTIIDSIEIDYKVDWPLTLVITKETMKTYNSIFKFLVHIKWALHSLHKLRFADIKETEENFTRLRLLYKLRLFLTHCVSTLHYYFLSFTPTHLRTKFEESLSRSHTLNNIITAHENYLEKLKVHCLLNKGNVLLKAVKQLLFMSSDLNKLWHKESTSELKFEEISELEEQYIRSHNVLNLLLKNAVELHPNPALQLLSMDIESCLPVWDNEIQDDLMP
ncbi:hypothetical protein LSTR_LSTR001516 [Laodelphax striatellus]|uniref:Gamma-tubulin complex component n=1 Tax=Laodelphax striatellus TaxID=195883 RepID=A0A482XBA6_LAOST|nr:hypothetical protein LSTR_LSTR001516 [Laodelphax striatellus]